MNVLLLGSGGREHSIAKKIKESKRLKKFYCAPGNPGIAQIAEIIDINPDETDKVIEFAKNNLIDLIICGPEKPLVNGLSEKAAKENILVFGPSSKGAILEGSKIYSKEFMNRHNIPTSSFSSFNNYQNAVDYIEKRLIFPVVIKADGLASGKGVKIAKTKDEAKATIKQYMVDKVFGKSGEKIIIEDFLTGEEMSFFYITDSKTFLPLIPAKDYKKAFDNDEGENTGGMGSYAPHSSISQNIIKEIESKIIKKIKQGFKKDNIDYRGVLYIGLMITDEGLMVLEFNCRFGDPETQVIMPLIENDLLEIMHAASKGKLESHSIKWKNGYVSCVVIASKGYPGEYKKGIKIKFNTDPYSFIHAGTIIKDNEIITNGGRVLNAVCTGRSKSSAIENAYRLAQKIKFEGSFYRKDIGK